MQNKIIGISGRLGSGKTTVSDYIKGIDASYKEVAFAFKLKQIVALLTAQPIETCLTQEGKNIYIDKFNMTIGEMLQKIGTDSLRNNFNENVWVNSLLLEIENNPGNYIISDCRFKNEADAIKKMGGKIIRINRPINPIAENSKRDLNHPSETSMDDYEKFDFVIENTGTMEDIREQVKVFLYGNN